MEGGQLGKYSHERVGLCRTVWVSTEARADLNASLSQGQVAGDLQWMSRLPIAAVSDDRLPGPAPAGALTIA